MRSRCRVFIVMGKTEAEAPAYRQQSMILVPRDTPGLKIVRDLSVFGYSDQEGHAEIHLDEVRVPAANLLGGEGDGFMMAQARLGPGRVHHCMRAIGAAEHALELLCRRALERVTFGAPVATRSNVLDWIAEARVDIEMTRLLTLKTAWMIDEMGNRNARTEIAAIKVAAPTMALRVIDRAMQIHGAAGMSGDFSLARSYAHMRCLRLADGPDEVHRLSIARRELARYERSESGAS
jgi:acyl-CoA dehydrogenase